MADNRLSMKNVCRFSVFFVLLSANSSGCNWIYCTGGIGSGVPIGYPDTFGFATNDKIAILISQDNEKSVGSRNSNDALAKTAASVLMQYGAREIAYCDFDADFQTDAFEPNFEKIREKTGADYLVFGEDMDVDESGRDVGVKLHVWDLKKCEVVMVKSTTWRLRDN